MISAVPARPESRVTSDEWFSLPKLLLLLAAFIFVAFPTVVTPYGISAVIVLLANSPARERTLTILGVVMVVMVLNLLVMLYARKLLGSVALMVLRILGAVLGVLQVALAVEMIIRALHGVGVLHG